MLPAVFPLVLVPLSITVEHGGDRRGECLCSYNSACFCSCVCRDCFPRLQVTNLTQVHLQGKNVLNDFYLILHLAFVSELQMLSHHYVEFCNPFFCLESKTF